MVVVLDVRKPEGSVGELRLTLGPHQRVIFGVSGDEGVWGWRMGRVHSAPGQGVLELQLVIKFSAKDGLARQSSVRSSIPDAMHLSAALANLRCVL